VDLIEAAPRLLPLLPEDISARVLAHLRHIGVNVFLNRALMKETIEGVYLKDMEMRTDTVIWTAGVMPNKLFAETPALPKDKKGRVAVDEYMEAQGVPNVFVLGDGASTRYSGMAQTALYDGAFAARVIRARSEGKAAPTYVPKPVAYAIPVGRNWAAALFHGLRFYGFVGAWMRRAADFRFFLSILPVRKAIGVFTSQKTVCESCSICLPKEA
jgi:NADH dehydrogenase